MIDDQFQVETESLIQHILKRDNDPVWIIQTLSAADIAVQKEVCHQFRTNELLRRSSETAAMLFDEVISVAQ